MHHPLGMTFGTRGKEDHRRLFRLLLDLRPMRHQQVRKDPQFVRRGHIGFEIFQIDPANLRQLLRQVPEFAFIQNWREVKMVLISAAVIALVSPLTPAV